MATILRDLYKHAGKKYKMSCLAGESNMNNLVKWVHMLEDPETASFLYGQELIFTTGIGHHSTDWLMEFAENLIKFGASALVINIGPYIQSLPDELLNYCKSEEFPLFTIPWTTRIVDITNDFCRQIISGEETETTVAESFRNLIFFPETANEYGSVLERKEFDLNASFCILALSLIVPSNDKFSEYEKKVMLHLTKTLFNYSDRFSIFRQDKHLIVVLQNFSTTVIEEILERLYRLCDNGESSYKLRAGISVNEIGLKSLARSYKRAIAVLEIAIKQNKPQIYYENCGLYQLLIEVEDTKVLKQFYKETIGQLVAYDEKHNSDYCYILKCYLDNNNSVEKVAKETYVHRNTINYKIKKIKEILQCDINYQDGLKLYLAYHIKEFL